MIDHDALIDRYIAGSIEADAFAQLTAWINASDANAQHFMRRAAIHNALRSTLTENRAQDTPPPRRLVFPIALSGVAAALLAACSVAIYVLVSSLPQSEIPDPTSNTPLATLIEATPGSTLTTPGGFVSEGRDYPSGEYTLDRGTAEFMLTNSVNVKLRGPTRLWMRNDMSVALTRGSAEFVCPSDAEGFTVHLPDKTRIVDLGTAFKIDVDDEGRTELRVTEGSVAWLSAVADAPSVLVAAGQTVRIAEGTLREVPVLTVSTHRSNKPPTISNTDLAQSHYLSSSSTGSGEAATRHAELFNGVIGNEDAASTNSGEVTVHPGDSITVNFDISTNTHGYDITGIETCFGWNPMARGRSNQGYEITLTYIDGSTATLVGPTHWEPNAPAAYWTTVSFKQSRGGTLYSENIGRNADALVSGPSVRARGVKTVTFKITHEANAGRAVVVREIDIFGEPTASPESNQATPITPENGNTPLKETPQ